MFKTNKKIIAVLFMLSFVLSMLSTSAFAVDSTQEGKTTLSVKKEIPVSEALKMVEGTTGIRMIDSLENVEKAYLMSNGQVCFKVTEKIVDSGSTETTEMESTYIPIADNINLFGSARASGYTRQWTKSKDFKVFYDQAEGYGVVSAYQSKSDSNDWYLEMKSNARGASAAYYLESFDWSVSHDNKSTELYDWSPSGYTTATQNIFPVNLSIELVGGAKISSSFDLLARKTTLNGGVSGNEYSVELYTNGYDIMHPKYQVLDALVSYLTGPGTTEWTWTWYATAYLLV